MKLNAISAASPTPLPATRSIDLILPREKRAEVVRHFIGGRPPPRTIRTLRVGMPGTWKTGASEEEALRWSLDPFEPRALLAVSFHSDMPQSLTRRLWAAGRGASVVLDEMGETKRVPAYGIFRKILGEGFEREVNLHNEVFANAEVFDDERGFMDRLNLHPFFRTWIVWALQLIFLAGLTPRDCTDLLRIGGPRLNALVEQYGDPIVREDYEELRTWSRMEIERQTGAARRALVTYYGNPVIRERYGDWDYIEFLASGGALLIDASGIAQEAARPFVLNIVLRSMQQSMQRGFPLLIIADEINRGLNTSAMLVDLLEQARKFRIGMTLCAQAPAFPPDLNARYFQAMDRLELFASSAEVVKDYLHHLWPLVDSYREHHRDVNWHQWNAGVEEVKRRRTSRTSTETKHGGEHPHTSKGISETTATDTMLVPRYREFATERIVYMSSNDQLMESAVEVMQQEPGSRLVIECGRAWFERVPWLNPVYPRGLEETYERRFQEFLTEMRARPYFRTPQPREEPLRIGAACRLQKIKAEANGSAGGSNGAVCRPSP